jgi:hypothetical protein
MSNYENGMGLSPFKWVYCFAELDGKAVRERNTRVYPKVSGLAPWSENCNWYSSLPLDVAVSLFCESV